MKTLLCEGMTGDTVKELQKKLGVVEDGIFGRKTSEACVEKFHAPWYITGTPSLTVVDTALIRLSSPMHYAGGNWIDTHILGPFRHLIGAEDGHEFPWCACWVHYCCRQVQPNFLFKSHQGRVFSSVSNWRHEAERLGCLKDVARDLTPGDLIAYDWNGDDVSDHIGILYKLVPDGLISLEGNASHSEAVRHRSHKSVSFAIDTEKLLKAYA